MRLKCNSIPFQTPSDIETVQTAISILIKYAANLLKGKDLRPSQWSRVMFKNAAFTNKVDPVIVSILHKWALG